MLFPSTHRSISLLASAAALSVDVRTGKRVFTKAVLYDGHRASTALSLARVMVFRTGSGLCFTTLLLHQEFYQALFFIHIVHCISFHLYLLAIFRCSSEVRITHVIRVKGFLVGRVIVSCSRICFYESDFYLRIFV